MSLDSFQIPLPFTAAVPPAERPPTVVVLRRGAEDFQVHLVRMRRARRYVLRVRPDGGLRVTVPRGGSRAEALRFAERHLAWAERERARQRLARRGPTGVRAGDVLLLDGELVTVVRETGDSVDVVRAGRLECRAAPGSDDLQPVLEAALLELAREELPPRLLWFAEEYNLAVSRVTIRNQRSRWGSCSTRGAIALNYRLVMMPPLVRDYVMLHELMHLREQNHSRRFWRLVEAVYPDFRRAEQWLKANGRGLF